jgi:hypothetical protein
MDSRVISHSREKERVERRLEELSRTYGLASRRMALVSVVERAGDRAGDVPKTVVVPVGMPQDMGFQGYFAPAKASTLDLGAMPFLSRAMPAMASPPLQHRSVKAKFSIASSEAAHPPLQPTGAPPTGPDVDDQLLEMIARILPDGGMPGVNLHERIVATVRAVMWLISEGHTLKRGAFRLHVARLTGYLQNSGKPELAEILAAIRAGKALPGDWSSGRAADNPTLNRLGQIS